MYCDWKPMSPTEDQVDSMVTAMATCHSSDHHHCHHVKTLPTFSLPGTVENNSTYGADASVSVPIPTYGLATVSP